MESSKPMESAPERLVAVDILQCVSTALPSARGGSCPVPNVHQTATTGEGQTTLPTPTDTSKATYQPNPCGSFGCCDDGSDVQGTNGLSPGRERNIDRTTSDQSHPLGESIDRSKNAGDTSIVRTVLEDTSPDRTIDHDGRPTNGSLHNGLPSTVLANGHVPVPVAEGDDILSLASDLIESKQLTESFYLMNITRLRQLYAAWTKLMPRIRPYYAVKCNADTIMIRLLHEMGAGFDCASEEEIKMVLQHGVSPSDIIFANPCKDPSELETGRRLGVDLSTFDSMYELKKIHRWTPDGRVLLRIRSDDLTASLPLGSKYGAEMGEVYELYREAKALGIDVVGVAFHVGSQAKDLESFSRAVAEARHVFDIGSNFGFRMSILDIGGGFMSGYDRDMSTFQEAAAIVNRSLDVHFPIDSGIRVIAEPGTFFAETCFTLATNIIGFRERTNDSGRHRDYWLTDGLYGSFHPHVHFLKIVEPIPLRMNGRKVGHQSISSTLFGPTCDSLDIIRKEVSLPELVPGDWIVFYDLGAYFDSCRTSFNGMKGARNTFYFYSSLSG